MTSLTSQTETSQRGPDVALLQGTGDEQNLRAGALLRANASVKQQTNEEYRMKIVKGLLIFLALASVLASGHSQAQEVAPEPDKAVVEYLKLRTEGKRHHEALSIVRAKFSITAAQLEEAANRISTNGYPDGIKPDPNERSPGSAAKPN